MLDHRNWDTSGHCNLRNTSTVEVGEPHILSDLALRLGDLAHVSIGVAHRRDPSVHVDAVLERLHHWSTVGERGEDTCLDLSEVSLY